MAFARTVIEENSVSEEIDKFIEKYPRLKEMWEGWTWRLSRGPERDGVQIPGTDAYVVRTPYFNAFQLPISLGILYKYNDDEVTIVGLRVDEYDS